LLSAGTGILLMVEQKRIKINETKPRITLSQLSLAANIFYASVFVRICLIETIFYTFILSFTNNSEVNASIIP
jgi:hypothetical protein